MNQQMDRGAVAPAVTDLSVQVDLTDVTSSRLLGLIKCYDDNYIAHY